jgi:hypothetical protein
MVHRNIVAIQSKPLAAAIDGEFMVRAGLLLFSPASRLPGPYV